MSGLVVHPIDAAERLLPKFRDLVAEAQTSQVCMANLLGQPGAGDFEPALRALLETNDRARFHWYGKAESRPGRKMGHVNRLTPLRG